MKKTLSISIIGILLSMNTLVAQDLLPSETYYKDNIAVNEISAKAPSLRNDDDDDDDGPPSGGTGGGGWVGSPIGDAIAPILIAGFSYAFFLFYRKRSA